MSVSKCPDSQPLSHGRHTCAEDGSYCSMSRNINCDRRKSMKGVYLR
jgi:hypothetical protein